MDLAGESWEGVLPGVSLGDEWDRFRKRGCEVMGVMSVDGSIAGSKGDTAVGGIGVVIAGCGMEPEVMVAFSKRYEGPTRVECPEQVTNNRMELRALLCGLSYFMAAYDDTHECGLVVISDSQYVVKGISEYMPRWIRRGWTNNEGRPIKNQDLWRYLNELLDDERCPDIVWKHVKGHSGVDLNEMADDLAQSEVR